MMAPFISLLTDKAAHRGLGSSQSPEKDLNQSYKLTTISPITNERTLQRRGCRSAFVTQIQSTID
ncbi:hypothetical protein PM082_000448 [Marasmius tenuissimus]|nr:hypothetical protein PM082_000448 [Marasmius tenuissimus]